MMSICDKQSLISSSNDKNSADKLSDNNYQDILTKRTTFLAEHEGNKQYYWDSINHKYQIQFDDTEGKYNKDGCIATYEFITCPKSEKGCKRETYTVDG